MLQPGNGEEHRERKNLFTWRNPCKGHRPEAQAIRLWELQYNSSRWQQKELQDTDSL